MKAFFGCRITMEMLIHKDRYAQYWRNHDNLLTETPGFAKVMSRDSFLAIWSLLHCVNEDDPDLDKTDKIYKSRPVFTYILENFKRYYVPSCELSLDEGMIPTKNKLSIKQYIKAKPIKWGIKTFLLCESKSGYIVNAEIYTGKRDDGNVIDNIGVTGNLVVRLTDTDEIKGQNHIVYTDRFYTTVTLAEILLTRGIRLCGTAMTNRLSFPKDLKRRSKELAKGEYVLLFNGEVAAIVWCDKRPVFFVSSVYVDAPVTTVQRYDATQQKRVPINCPEAVKSYNIHMGGTNLNDQMTRLHKCRRHYKWPRRLIMKFFMWAAYNNYVQMNYQKPHKAPNKKIYTFHFFLEKLCLELVGDVRNTTQRGRRRSNGDVEGRLQDYGNHEVQRAPQATGNNRCVVCIEKNRRARLANPDALERDLPTKHRTVHWCKKCKAFLCIGTEGSNCWASWHTQVRYWL